MATENDEKVKLVVKENQFKYTNMADEKQPLKALDRNLTFSNCFFTVVGFLLGSGLYMSPALVAKRTPNSFVALCVWLFAGFISLLGSLCYCELVSVIRKTGSSYIFVYETYGKFVAFPLLLSILFGLIPFGLNVIILTASTYACAPFIADETSSEFYWASRITALVMLLLTMFVSCFGARSSARVQVVINAIQLFSIAALVVAGIYYMAHTKDVENFKPDVFFNNTISGISKDVPSLGTAIFSALFCFDGWFIIASFAEEIKNPKKNLPLVAGTGIPFVTILYVIVNLACLSMLTHGEMGETNVVFTKAFEKLGISGIKYVVPLFVCASCLSSLLSAFFHHSRFIMSAAREGQLPKVLSLIHPHWNTPIPAIIMMTVVMSVALFSGFDIEETMQYYNIAIWLEYGMAFSIVIYLRYKLPDVKRTYRVWISTPIFMLLISILLTILLLINYPYGGVVVLIAVFVLTPLYWLSVTKDCCKSLKFDFGCGWLVRHTSLITNKFDESGWEDHQESIEFKKAEA